MHHIAIVGGFKYPKKNHPLCICGDCASL